VKITFEAPDFRTILAQMEDLLLGTSVTARSEINPQSVSAPPKTSAQPKAAPVVEAQGPSPDELFPVDKPVDKPVDSPVMEQAKKAAAADKMAKLRAAKDAKKAAKAAEAAAAPAPAPKSTPKAAPAEALDPVEVVKIRAKTIEDLQTAYANGHQKEVFELLSRFGNGAKSFRELPPEAFMPIREAIDNGALT
jgi:hypothetical protein